MPKVVDDCAAQVSAHRSQPYYSLDSANFAQLHPEENQWVNSRLDKVEVEIRKRIQKIGQTLGGLDDPRLKIAISHSGGGKRSMFHSTGTSTST
jgi:hypothetical protein